MDKKEKMLKHSLKQIFEKGNIAKMIYVCHGIVYYQINIGDSSY